MSDILTDIRVAFDADRPSSKNVMLRRAHDEIERLQDAKRRALALADERSKENVDLRAEIERLRAALFKIQCEQLRIATATDMTRPAMREAAMDTRNEIIKVLAVEQSIERVIWPTT